MKIIFVGDGPSKSALIDLVYSFDLADNIDFVGYHSNPLKFIRKADLFVLPSRHEGSPLVLVEALACQVPILATDCYSGPRETLSDGHYGLIVPPNDALSLSKSIIDFFELKISIPASPQERLTRAMQFDSTISATNYLDVFKHLIERNPKLRV